MQAVIADKYDVRGVLGQGGTGIVYDALRREDGRNVAVKVMHDELAGNTQVQGRFKREAAILRRLEGPHICPILDFGETANDQGKAILYITLPRLDGPSLEEVLKREPPLPIDRIIGIALEICAALRIAHAQGVIHRDLKPANVILEKGERVVVVDFGLSKIVSGEVTGTTDLTAHNMMFGTPEYMSPEQARGDELDPRCDVYAVGVILYELLTGKPPFTGTTPLGILTAHLTSDLAPPSGRAGAERVPPKLERIVLKALARDREERYPTIIALEEALSRARVSSEVADGFAATMPSVAPLATTGTKVPTRAQARRQNDAKVVTRDPTLGAWVAAWIVAAILSIGAGVYFALR